MRRPRFHIALCALILAATLAFPATADAARVARSGLGSLGRYRDLVRRIRTRHLTHQRSLQSITVGGGVTVGDLIGYIPVYGPPPPPAYGSPAYGGSAVSPAQSPSPTPPAPSPPSSPADSNSTAEDAAVGVIVGYLPIYDSLSSYGPSTPPPMYGFDITAQALGVDVDPNAGIVIGGFMPVINGLLGGASGAVSSPAYGASALPGAGAGAGVGAGAGGYVSAGASLRVTIGELVPVFGSGVPPAYLPPSPSTYGSPALPASFGVASGGPVDVIIGGIHPVYGGPTNSSNTSSSSSAPPSPASYGSSSPPASAGAGMPMVMGGMLTLYAVPGSTPGVPPPPPSPPTYNSYTADTQPRVILGVVPFLGPTLTGPSTPPSPSPSSSPASSPASASVGNASADVVIGELPAYAINATNTTNSSSSSSPPAYGASGTSTSTSGNKTSTAGATAGLIIGWLPISQAQAAASVAAPSYGGPGYSGGSSSLFQVVGNPYNDPEINIGYVAVFGKSAPRARTPSPPAYPA